MSYAKEFNHENYNVPEFLLKDPAWVDCSWHNDVAPRWENSVIGLAVWVECINPELREIDNMGQYVVVELIYVSEDENTMHDEDILQTEDAEKLQMFVELYPIKKQLEQTTDLINKLATPFPDLADEIATALALVNQEMQCIQGCEVPDCSPSGERM